MRSANPALNSKTFSSTRNIAAEQPMTIDGTVNKTALSLLFLMTSAIYTWNNPELSFMLFLPIVIFTLCCLCMASLFFLLSVRVLHVVVGIVASSLQRHSVILASAQRTRDLGFRAEGLTRWG